MTAFLHRRNFLKTAWTVSAAFGAARLWASPTAKLASGAPRAEKIGWRLGCQAYSFNRFTFFDAIDKTASLGLGVIEAYPGQAVGKDMPNVHMSDSMTPDVRKDLKAKLADAGVKLVNYGVCGLSKDPASSRKLFDFAQDMGIETIVAEPPDDAFDLLDKLTEEYGINLAIHNHPRPSHYWNPDVVLAACKNHSKRIGACCDTGHWVRSGLVPVECLKKLEGRIISFHFKDLNKFAPDGHDVAWGTGVSDVRGMLTEVHRQRIKAVFSIEWEFNWDNSVPDMVPCVEFFDKFAAGLGGAT